jgi:cysteine desulfurase
MIYLDYHATTPMIPEVWEAMQPYLTENFGNPGSAHQAGRKARRSLEDARESIASRLGAFPDEIIFTSGATEANNLALFGLIGNPPGHILASLMEHPCVIEPIKQLEGIGFDLEWLQSQPNGLIPLERIVSRIRPDTRLLTLMLVNHETGVIQRIGDCGRVLGELPSPPLFHCDAAQAVGKIAVHFHQLSIDAMTVSAHKFHGPKGIGVLVLKRCVKLHPLLYGGHQQQGRRPGTESVALAVGMARALEYCIHHLEERTTQVTNLRRRFMEMIRSQIPDVVINTPFETSSPYVLNLSFPHCRAEMLLMKLDLMGVACSTGSACSSGSLLPSPVLHAMQVPEEILRSAMRFSFNPSLTEQEIETAAKGVCEAVNKVREE